MTEKIHGFLLSFLLFCLVTGVIGETAALRLRYPDAALEHSGFYTIQYEHFLNRLYELTPSSGVEEEFFAALVTPERFRRDMHTVIQLSLQGVDITAAKETLVYAMRDEAYEKLCVYAQQQGYTLTDELKKALDHLAEIVRRYYSSAVAGGVQDKVFRTAGKAIRLLSRWGIPLCVLLALSAAACFWRLRRSRTSLSAALLGSALMLALPLPVAAIAGLKRRVFVLSDAFSALLTDYAGGVLLRMLIAGLALAVIAAALLIVRRVSPENDAG